MSTDGHHLTFRCMCNVVVFAPLSEETSCMRLTPLELAYAKKYLAVAVIQHWCNGGIN